MSRIKASRLYPVMDGANAFLRSTMYLVITIYYVLVVHMNPLQLVLAGTALELSYFLFQMPTGVFADIVSRRISIILGWTICGIVFAVEGLVPNVTVILVAQAVLGLGEACIDGAESAWLADEVGPNALGGVMLRASQVAQVTSITGTVAAVALGTVHLSLPVVVGGIGMIGMSVFFALAMPEDGFEPAHHRESTTRPSLVTIIGNGMRLVRGSNVLLTILGAEIFIGGGSEGFDRLWRAHLIRDIHLPAIGSVSPVWLFAILAILQSAVAFAANRWLRPRLAALTENPRTMARKLSALHALFAGATVAFALSGNIVTAVLFLLGRSAIESPGTIMTEVWLNRSITDSSVRATVLSISGQCNAMGQWIGGPIVGILGNVISLPTALVASGVIHSPVSLLFGLAARRHGEGRIEEAVSQAQG